MLRFTRVGFITVVASSLALTGLVRFAAAQAAPAPDTDPNSLKTVLVVEGQPNELFFTDVAGALAQAAAPEVPGKYWIGLRCSNVDGALRAQLGLAEGKGLLVDEVVPDSPAKKAGVAQFDVLVKYGDRELTTVGDLVEAVQKTETKEIEVGLIRAGKPLTLKVTPAEHSHGATPTRIAVVAEPNVDYQQLHSLIERLQKGGQGDINWKVVRPGVVMQHVQRQFGSLPKGLSISITKSGDEEAKIVVQRGDQKWEATEKTLDKLPDDVRRPVESFLHGRPPAGAFGMMGSAGIGAMVPPQGQTNIRSTISRNRTAAGGGAAAGTTTAVPMPPGAAPGVGAPAGVFISTPPSAGTQKQLDEIKQQLEELRKAVEALKTKQE